MIQIGQIEETSFWIHGGILYARTQFTERGHTWNRLGIYDLNNHEDPGELELLKKESEKK